MLNGRKYELLICSRCMREKVRPEDMENVVRCFCGCEDFELYDLVPVARDCEERPQLAEGVSADAVAA